MGQITATLMCALPAAFGMLGCANGTCQNKYTPRDQFKITINGSLQGDTPCDLMPLHVGDSFVLTVGDVVRVNQDGCALTYAGPSQVPAFVDGVLTECYSVESPTTMTCCGVLNGCQMCLNSQVSALPSGSQRVIEHATLMSTVSSSVVDWGALDGGACVPRNCAWDEYDVTIETLVNGVNN